MNKQFLKDAIGWGAGLWFVGYVLGFVFFAVMAKSLIGWAIMPIGIIINLWVLLKKINGQNIAYYLKVAIAWALIAILLDYIFLVQLLRPADGYYKLDVFLYYALTFILPLAVGYFKIKK